MTTTQIVTLYVLAGLAELLGVALAAVEVRRTLNDLRANAERQSTWADIEHLGRRDLDQATSVASLRLTAVALLLGGVILGTIANIASALHN